MDCSPDKFTLNACGAPLVTVDRPNNAVDYFLAALLLVPAYYTVVALASLCHAPLGDAAAAVSPAGDKAGGKRDSLLFFFHVDSVRANHVDVVVWTVINAVVLLPVANALGLRDFSTPFWLTGLVMANELTCFSYKSAAKLAAHRTVRDVLKMALHAIKCVAAYALLFTPLFLAYRRG